MRARKVYEPARGGGVPPFRVTFVGADFTIVVFIRSLVYTRGNFLLTQCTYVRTVRMYVRRVRRSPTLRERLRRRVEWNGIIREEKKARRRRWKRRRREIGGGGGGGYKEEIRGLENRADVETRPYRLSYTRRVDVFLLFFVTFWAFERRAASFHVTALISITWLFFRDRLSLQIIDRSC